jgi:hypothetical protein
LVGSVLKRSSDRVVRSYLVEFADRLEAARALSTFGPALSLDAFEPALSAAGGVDEPPGPGLAPPAS